MLPPQCQQDVTALRSFVRETIDRSQPVDAVSPGAFQEVLLTGATGFVGRYLLGDLLRQNSKLTVYCLIRDTSVDTAEKRLQSILQKNKLWEENYGDRIRTVVGDIDEHHFGLTDEQFADLCQRIDAVYHCAATLSLAVNYLRLRRNNVFSTRNIVELSLTTRFKHVFFISTLGIFPEYFCTFGREFESCRIKDESQPDIELMKRHFPPGLIGYPWSKLVCEQALLFAHAAGMPLAIFRLPTTGIASSGYVNHTDLVVRFSAAAYQVEMAPIGFSARKHGDPVDILTEICAGISLNPTRQHLIYHCCEKDPVFYDIDPADTGVDLQEVPYPEFKQACLAQGKHSPLDGYWMLIDHFSKYWFYDRDSTSTSNIDDQAIRNDCPNPIHWPNGLTKVIRMWDWIAQPENEWPYLQPKFELDYDRLVDRARSYAESMNVPFESTYPSWMLQGLEQIVEAMKSPGVKPRESRRGLGILQVCRLLLENAQLARERSLHSEIDNENIRNPVFIVGINRTGTTFLHRLMARDPRFWTLLTYELMSTSVLPDGDYATMAGTEQDSRRQFVRDYFEATNLPENLSGIHPMEMDEPVEDIKLLALSFTAWTSNILRNSSQYNEWLEKTGSRHAYLHHRRVLQHFNWQRRMTESTQTDKSWLLKMPFHLMELDHLIATYPDSCFIQTHRAPHEFIGSWISLVENFRIQSFEPQPRHELGKEQLNFMGKMMNRAIDFRTRHPELESRWIDIKYTDFVQNPTKVVAGIYQKFDWPLESEALKKMENWRKHQHAQRKREAPHRYDLADFGLTKKMVNSVFEPYLDYFKQLDL